MKQTPYQSLKKKLLADPEIHSEYKRLGLEFDLVRKMIKKRTQRGLSQAALAKKLKTKQSAIARLESGSYNPSFAFLSKVAAALDTRVVVSFIDHHK